MEHAVDKARAELAAALVAFQGEVPAVDKKRTANTGTYKYSYADLSDIWDAVRKPLATHKLAVTQMLIGGSDGYTGIETTIWHESGASIVGVVEVPTQGKTAQEAGSLFTYYKRYALGAALGISTEDDDDGAAGNVAPQTAPKASDKKPASEKQRGYLAELAHKKGKNNAWIDATLEKVKTSADASAVIDQLKALKDAS